MDEYKDQASPDPFEETNDEAWDETAVSSAEDLILAAPSAEEPEPAAEEKKKEKSRVSDTALTRRESFRVNRILYLTKLKEKAEEIEGQEAQERKKEEQEVTETGWLDHAAFDSEMPESAEAREPETAEVQEPEISDTQEPETAEVQEAESSDAKEPEPEEAREPETSDIKEPETEEVQEPEVSDVKEPEPEEAREPEETQEEEPEAAAAESSAETEKPKKSRKILCGILYGLTGLLVFLISLVGLSANWAFTKWGEIDINEIIFQLQAPLGGTGDGMVGDFLLKALLPSVLILAVFIVLLILMKKGKRRIIVSCAFLLCALIAGLIIRNGVWKRLDLDSWLAGQQEESVFIQEQYVDPEAVSLRFPEQKRNLIFIYLESMETTFADKASGGAFKKNVIPELTKLAQENEDFSGKEKELNGGVVLPGTNYTTGAIFGMSTGLPLRISIGANAMAVQNTFFPGIIGLGDILEEQGYNQVFMLGSDATFGARRLYFENHGDYEIQDYKYAQEHKWIPPGYFEFWGFEDEILFKNAKKTLQKLAKEDKPFNLTLLTVDTHFEDGYVCDLCKEEFGNDQYSNVMACSSRQVEKFVEWIKKQDFYENTTIVLTGDHITMDTDYCRKVPDSYSRRAYTTYINAAQKPDRADRKREYTTLDNFPTTLAALGVKIPGNRLGLGTNLFSNKKTLIEEYGYERLRREFDKKSDFLDRLESVEEAHADDMLEFYRENMTDAITIDRYDKEKGTIALHVTVSNLLGIIPTKMELEYQEAGSKTTVKRELTPKTGDEIVFSGTIDISKWKSPEGELRINMYVDEKTVFENVASLPLHRFYLEDLDFIDYFNELSNHPEYTIFLAVKDDASTGMTDEMQLAIEKIGVETVLSTAPQVSYYAVVDNGFVMENNGYENLHYDGIIEENGVPYSIESSGYTTGSTASIRIDGVDYAPNKRGLNVVVYDSAKRQVIDRRRFDTSADPFETEAVTETPVW